MLRLKLFVNFIFEITSDIRFSIFHIKKFYSVRKPSFNFLTQINNELKSKTN